MKYCKKCVLPDTRPNLVIKEDGICNACHSHDLKPDIDWDKRHRDFLEVVKSTKASSTTYDCLIPVSGGKDSTWQTHMCIKYGLKPLALTWAPPGRTEVGHENLQNLINLGVDHIDYRINPKTEKKFMWKAFKKFGAMGIPMHMAIFSIPLSVAKKFNIPLIVFGENSAAEYGNEDKKALGYEMNETWLKNFGVTHGTGPNDWIDDELTAEDLVPYQRPSGKELQDKGIKAIFLGEYFKWEPNEIKSIAGQLGFKYDTKYKKTGYYEFADLDDDFISIHHWMKWYKFGFTRLFDNLSLEIRNGRMTREKAIETIIEMGEQTPYKDIEKCCDFMEINKEEFYNVAEGFRNLDVWKQKDGKWKIQNFIINDWNW